MPQSSDNEPDNTKFAAKLPATIAVLADPAVPVTEPKAALAVASLDN